MDLGKIKKIFCRAYERKRTANSCICRAPRKNARQSFFKNRHFICLKCGRGENVLCRASWRKRTANKIFAVRFFRAHGKELICRAFFLYRALYKKRTANKLFAVRPKKTHGKDFGARQTRVFR
jgi:hypothetical protein